MENSQSGIIGYKRTEKERAYARAYYWRNRKRVAAVRRNRHLIQTYGISQAEYEQLVAQQHGKCAICSIEPKRRLVVDHCHRTNKIRKLLCDNCNRGLGLLGDHNLEAALAYVRA